MTYAELRELAALFGEVRAELIATEHRPFPWHDPVRGAALVAEETGELIQVVLDATRGDRAPDSEDLTLIAMESRQVAALAIRMMAYAKAGLRRRDHGIQLVLPFPK